MKKITLLSLFVFASFLANAQNWKSHPKKPYSGTDSCLVWQDSTKKFYRIKCSATVSGGGGTTTNAVTFNSSGTGDASGTTFNGSAARTISHNSIGAAPLASPTFTGTVTIPSGAVMNTPVSIGLTNGTGLPVSTGISGMGVGITTWLATPSSANLRTAITDETGTGVSVFATSPTFTTNITTPLIIGGTSTTSGITYKTTTGVGTTGADHTFQVGNNGATTAMTITNSAMVGIGITNPVAQLHVSSEVANSTRGLVIEQHSTDAASAPIFFRKSRATLLSPTTVADQDFIGVSAFASYDGASYLQTAGFGARVSGTVTTGSVPTDLFFYAGSVNTTNPYTAGLVRMVINSGGDVGIGTSSPTSKLHLREVVAGSTAGDISSFQKSESDIGSSVIYGLETIQVRTEAASDVNTVAMRIRSYADLNELSYIQYGDRTGGISFGTAPTLGLSVLSVPERMRILANGNVGIGTSSPTAKLHVEGTVVIKSYTVATLPACAAGIYTRATVTDALAPVYDATVAGGGARVIEVICNGSTWVCH